MRTPTLSRSLAAVALAGALTLTGCSSDEPDATADSAASQPAGEDAASEPADLDPQAVADSANASYAVLIEETLAALDAGLADDAMDDFPAFIDEWYPETSQWLAWDTFQSEVHGYAMLRTFVGLAMISVGMSDDPEAAAGELLESVTIEPSWVSFEGEVASVADPEAPAEDSIPVNLVERDGEWLIEGSVFDDAWFEEQGTTAEEALNS